MSVKDIRNGYWKEKWNYSPKFIGPVSEETKNDFLIARIMNVHQVSSLIWTTFEKHIIAAAIRAGNNLLKMNGFKSIRVFDNQIIVLDKAVYEQNVKMSDNEGGKCSFGHVFLRRNEDRCHFVVDVAHEISHLFSFYSVSVKEDKECRSIDFYQLGFHSLSKKGNSSCFGLNEAATDLWSKVILREMDRAGFLNNLFSKEEKDRIFYEFAYGLHVFLIEEVFLNKSEKLIWPFFKSYFDGSNDFLELVKQEMPEVLRIIQNVDNTRESVVQAAYEIGGDKLRDKILQENVKI